MITPIHTSSVTLVDRQSWSHCRAAWSEDGTVISGFTFSRTLIATENRVSDKCRSIYYNSIRTIFLTTITDPYRTKVSELLQGSTRLRARVTDEFATSTTMVLMKYNKYIYNRR